ncbi:MAG TPA: 3-methyl-2-oxobutanoate hydroxymethyltransferase, partial [Cytophagales bacterium]|nr:3-methyl-2-oxobutanoate hydroxymethyltransferase [Cytophagales bacterium]
AVQLVEDALLLEQLGCFGVVLEKIPADLGKRVSEAVAIPTIGIGAGPHLDGQVLVSHDMLGVNKEFHPRFLRRYADLDKIISDAVSHYIRDVKAKDFPNIQESY